MSEYWVSKKKYYCQYCEIYIADDAPSRSQHENGLRHKGNKDRFIRGLYKSGIKKKQESEEEKREMKRVEEAAQAAYARDIGAGLAKPGASSSPPVPATAPKPKPPPPKPSDPYTNYTTAASLGITDPDVELLIAQTEVRKSEGRAGDWVAVVPPPPPLPGISDPSASGGVKSEPGTSVGEVRKREEEPVDDDDARHFKMRKKTVAVGLGEIYDPGVIYIKPRVDTKVKADAEVGSIPTSRNALGGEFLQGDTKGTQVDSVPNATEKPTWTRREWKWAGEDQPLDEPSQPGYVGESRQDAPGVATTLEEKIVAIKPENHDPDIQPKARSGVIKEEPPNPQVLLGTSTGGNLFRKRKTPRGSSTRGRRQD